MNPTTQQFAIIEHVGNPSLGSLVVDARAGVGKTKTLELASYRIDERHSTLALAFNKKIATELSERLPSFIDCKTMNALGHRAWMSAVTGRITLDTDKMYNILQKVVPTDHYEELADRADEISACLRLCRQAKSTGLVPMGATLGKTGPVPDTEDEWEEIALDNMIDLSEDSIGFCRKALRESIKQAYSGTIDFDDQIYMSVLFGGKFPRYHTVLVDEAQDLSRLNHMMLQKLNATRMIVIGDPYQAIYGFRGATKDSINELAEMFDIEHSLPLTQSFRVSKAAAARQLNWVPDFEAHESTRAGQVEHWPNKTNAQGQAAAFWSIEDIPDGGAVICRNNAPLMKMAFTLIRNRRKVTVLGRDIGANMANTLKKICKKQMDLDANAMLDTVEAWKKSELEKCQGKESRMELVHDRAESLRILIEAAGYKCLGATVDFILALFGDKSISGVTLCSGHRAKGLEWNWVMHLDPWRVPSKFAKKALDQGNVGPHQQEMNLRYVIETRTKDILVLANLEDCTETQGGS